MKKKRRIVLAYSGGLDTSIILKWLQENYNAEIIAYTADIGQKIDKKRIINNAKKLGVKKNLPIQLDVRNKKEVFQTIEELPNDFKKISILINKDLDLFSSKINQK